MDTCFFPDANVLYSAIFSNEEDPFSRASRKFLKDENLVREGRIKVLDSVQNEFDKLTKRLRERFNNIVEDTLKPIEEGTFSLKELSTLIKRHLKGAIPTERRFIWIVGYGIFTLFEENRGEFARKLKEHAMRADFQVLLRLEEFDYKLSAISIVPTKRALKKATF